MNLQRGGPGLETCKRRSHLCVGLEGRSPSREDRRTRAWSCVHSPGWRPMWWVLGSVPWGWRRLKSPPQEVEEPTWAWAYGSLETRPGQRNLSWEQWKRLSISSVIIQHELSNITQLSTIGLARWKVSVLGECVLPRSRPLGPQKVTLLEIGSLLFLLVR